MAKTFAPRVSKKKRKTIDLSDKLSRDLLALADKSLFKDARLEEIPLRDIIVKEQVRTKFNDSSLKELSENIKINGLIQPLVVHEVRGKKTLICGERRFRAMGLINKKTAPCFILDDKSEEELMAIQFSENSSREELHFIDKAEGILNYQRATKASERKIMKALGISKSEVHRSLLIAKLPMKIKEAAKKYNTEKYVLVEYDAVDTASLRKALEKQITAGEITKRAQLKKFLADPKVLKTSSPRGRKPSNQKKVAGKRIPRGTSASAFLKAMNQKKKNLDPQTRALLDQLVEESKDLLN